MSSTNRGYDRHKTDFYVTPKWCIKDFLSAWLYDLENEDEYNHISARPDRVLWFDPCAGGDKDHGMSYPEVLSELFEIPIGSNDIREDSLADSKKDYLKEDFKDCADVIITNPPFYLAKEIIEKALEDVRDGGMWLCCLD